MTKEESKAKLSQLRLETGTLVKDYNEAIRNNKFEEATKADKEMTEKINEYTGVARDMCFEECKNTENPMLTAIKILTYTTIAVKDKKKDEEKFPTRVIEDREKNIDLLKLDKYCDGIGANENWIPIVQKMNCLMTAQKCADLGLDPRVVNDSYAMNEIARGYDMGKNPTSKTNLLKTLQTVITAMIGDEYKATSHDVNFLISVYAKKSRRALTVTCANHKALCGYLAEICHRIVANKSYDVEYKRNSK